MKVLRRALPGPSHLNPSDQPSTYRFMHRKCTQTFTAAHKSAHRGCALVLYCSCPCTPKDGPESGERCLLCSHADRRVGGRQLHQASAWKGMADSMDFYASHKLKPQHPCSKSCRDNVYKVLRAPGVVCTWLQDGFCSTARNISGCAAAGLLLQGKGNFRQGRYSWGKSRR